MCLREGDNVATRNPTSSAENWHASISLQQSGALFRSCHSQPVSALITLLLHNNNCQWLSPTYCVLEEELAGGH